MLKVLFGNCEDAIYNTSVYFKNTYQDEWITDNLSVEMIKDIDRYSKYIAFERSYNVKGYIWKL